MLKNCGNRRLPCCSAVILFCFTFHSSDAFISSVLFCVKENFNCLFFFISGSMVLSTGADGNFFQFSFMSQEAMEEKIKENKARLPSAKVRDI